ncbi:MAG: FHA domain-containing protein [Alphaproteobacteria bacterium]|nr:FHA domain-containing protein [Alphaproteobacteria bacterium]
MATKRCNNNHYYEDSYPRCPYCPVVDPSTINKTVANPRPGETRTEAANTQAAPGGGNGSSPPPQGQRRQPGDGKTIPMMIKTTRIDPVVGWLICVKGSNKGRDYRLLTGRNNVGRAPDMDVLIEGDETISRERQCEVVYSMRSKAFHVVPGTGRNLIELNNEEVLERRALQPYDRIGIGQSVFMFIPLCGDKFDWDEPPADTAAKPAS